MRKQKEGGQADLSAEGSWSTLLSSLSTLPPLGGSSYKGIWKEAAPPKLPKLPKLSLVWSASASWR